MQTAFLIDAQFISDQPNAIETLPSEERGVIAFNRRAREEDWEEDLFGAMEKLVAQIPMRKCRVVYAALTVTRYGTKGPRSRVFDLRNSSEFSAYFDGSWTDGRFASQHMALPRLA